MSKYKRYARCIENSCKKRPIQKSKTCLEHTTCTICMQPLTDLKNVCRLKKCNHYYHTICIQSWKSVKNECPQCRVPIACQHTSHNDTMWCDILQKNRQDMDKCLKEITIYKDRVRDLQILQAEMDIQIAAQQILLYQSQH